MLVRNRVLGGCCYCNFKEQYPKTLNPKTLNPKTLNPKTLNPKPLVTLRKNVAGPVLEPERNDVRAFPPHAIKGLGFRVSALGF